MKAGNVYGIHLTLSSGQDYYNLRQQVEKVLEQFGAESLMSLGQTIVVYAFPGKGGLLGNYAKITIMARNVNTTADATLNVIGMPEDLYKSVLAKLKQAKLVLP